MKFNFLPSLIVAGLAAGSAAAQHAQVSAVVIDPTNNQQVWVCNRDNHTVSLIDASAGSVIAEIPVGINPRSLSFSANGTRALIPHVLHNINHDVNFNFGPGLAGDFANRVYPALTVLDAANESYNAALDNSPACTTSWPIPCNPPAWVPLGLHSTTPPLATR